MPMIKPKLTLLQMQSKGMFRHAIGLSQATLGKAPKFRSIGNNLRVHLITAFKQSKDDGFTASASSTLTAH